MKLFSDQYKKCKEENLIGIADGSKIVIDCAYPNKKIRDYVKLHGKLPVLKSNSCKKFGGDCWGGNPDCKKLRSE
jgi:hypothetical protein